MTPTAESAYLTQSKRSCELALPLISRIRAGSLFLANYKLERTHFDALQSAFRIEPDLCHSVTLAGCGLSDQAFCSLVGAVTELKNVREMHVAQLSAGPQALPKLCGLVCAPNRL